ncbi:MAG: hypothetical protein AAF889_06445 [Cyanobacteria bacterium P01_D01_bin.73]
MCRTSSQNSYHDFLYGGTRDRNSEEENHRGKQPIKQASALGEVAPWKSV